MLDKDAISFIDNMFHQLMLGNPSVINVDNIQMINTIALNLYNKQSELNSDEVETLKKIIMICNVLYNRTDMTVLPIEDGFYDLLLEKYKVYDSNFQVGSAIVDFKNFIENDPRIRESIHDYFQNVLKCIPPDNLTKEPSNEKKIEKPKDSAKTKKGKAASKKKISKKEQKIRTYFNVHFKKEIYVDRQEEIINAVLSSKDMGQVKQKLDKIYRSEESGVVYKRLKPLLKELGLPKNKK
jgi:hypothetical protein